MRYLTLLLAMNLLGQSAEERMKLGFEKFQRSGMLAQQGKFEEAHRLMAEATAEIDATVASEPENATLRYRRGSVYAQLPDFLNKKATAREDLEIAVRDARYQEKASALLSKLTGGKPRERFSGVPADTRVVAVASVTLAEAAPLRTRSDLPPLLGKLMQQIEGYPGFLGSHVLSSADREGMILLFTWWKDKQSRARWVDGAAHQAAIGEIYSHPASSKATSTQVAMELLMPLAGSMQFGGGLAPKQDTRQ